MENNSEFFDIKDKRRFYGEEKHEDREKDFDNTKSPSKTQSFEINFISYILGMSSSAIIALGDMENPITGKKEMDLSVAKQIIDILGILEEKTKGNLSKEEEGALKGILYNLRISYVKKIEIHKNKEK